MNDIQRQVKKVYADKNLSQEEKSRLVQELMTKRWRESQNSNNNEVSKPRISYTNEDSKTLGCIHYQRGCMIRGVCCDSFYTCRLCHDDKEQHQIDRYTIDTMYCMYCETIQDIGQLCNHCNVSMSKYYCDICHLFNDNDAISIYHCDKCGICRLGKGLDIDYIHCDICNCDIGIDLYSNHKCIEGILDSNCPICNEYMFTSRKTVTFLRCGHSIHSSCLKRYAQVNTQCPLCLKSICDMSGHYRRLDTYVQSIVMPEEYSTVTANILCNDCLHKGKTPYRFMYHKCESCGSFNTSLLSATREEGE